VVERRESEDRGDGVGEASFEALDLLDRFEGVDARDAKSTSSSCNAMASSEKIIEGCCWSLSLHDHACSFIEKLCVVVEHKRRSIVSQTQTFAKLGLFRGQPSRN
jgi:hypothetical protein